MSYLHDTLQNAIDRAIPHGEIFDNVFRDALESLCLALQDDVPIRVLLDGLSFVSDRSTSASLNAPRALSL